MEGNCVGQDIVEIASESVTWGEEIRLFHRAFEEEAFQVSKKGRLSLQQGEEKMKLNDLNSIPALSAARLREQIEVLARVKTSHLKNRAKISG